MFFQGGYFYYATIGLQIFCAIHSINRGTQSKWIWIIIFLPVIGSLIYIYSEILTNSRVNTPNINLGAIFDPGGKIRKLENDLRFTDTFANRIKLADAYLEAGDAEKAIELYNASLTGAFTENEHVLAQLVIAYYQQGDYDKVIPVARKIYKLPQFMRSRAHILFARALENTGDIVEAESEFKAMKGRYAYFGARYEYGLFLLRANRDDDAAVVFSDILDEEEHLSPIERKSNRTWFLKTREAMKNPGAYRVV